jgi:hypothetical protein
VLGYQEVEMFVGSRLREHPLRSLLLPLHWGIVYTRGNEGIYTIVEEGEPSLSIQRVRCEVNRAT